MNFCEWKKSNSEYGRKLLRSGLEGARHGREEFLDGEPMAPFLNGSAQGALTAAVLGVAVGVLGAFAANRRRPAATAVACGTVGGVLGFGVGMAWESRRLGASVVSGALKNIDKARDEHWLEKNPIDYA